MLVAPAARIFTKLDGNRPPAKVKLGRIKSFDIGNGKDLLLFTYEDPYVILFEFLSLCHC